MFRGGEVRQNRPKRSESPGEWEIIKRVKGSPPFKEKRAKSSKSLPGRDAEGLWPAKKKKSGPFFDDREAGGPSLNNPRGGGGVEVKKKS